jgi:hypothetical protein
MITGTKLIEQNPEIISAYTRADALEDGQQVDVSQLAREAGFRFPVYMTLAAYNATVAAGGRWVDREDGDGQDLELPCGQDSKGRLWDVLNVLLFSIRRARGTGSSRIEYKVSVYGYDGTHRRHDVELVSVCGPTDADDPAPALTIMLPNED